MKAVSIARRALRYLLPLVGLVVAMSLSGCGGGDNAADTVALTESPGKQIATAKFAAEADPAKVIALTKISERRIARTVYEYVYSITVKNGSTPQQSIVATITNVGSGTTVVNGSVNVGELLANASVTPTGTITLRHDRAKPFDLAAITWQVTGNTLVDALIEGATLMGAPNSTALVGQMYSNKIRVVANDKRNAISSFAIANPTVGGASPTIDVTGALTWTPNEADFAGNKVLAVTVALNFGPATELSVPVKVSKERLIHSAPLPAAAATISDARGRYLIKVEPQVASTGMVGTLTINEIYDANGGFIYVIKVPKNANTKITVLEAPNLANFPTAAVGNSAQLAVARALSAKRINAAKAPATAWQADIGGRLSADLAGDGQVANWGEVNVYTTRKLPFNYWSRPDFAIDVFASSAFDPHTFQVDANCTSESSCGAIQSTDAVPVKLSPVILIHGFNIFQSVGGGDGTWGSLADVLTKRGHPVFELRWNTYMRFEEAAGVLALLGNRVASITGRKVSVIAHSFGGIVSHQAMLGQGIRFQGESWQPVIADGVFKRLITLGSPLSGISKAQSSTLGLTYGRDDDDIQISACEAITCFQAGSSDSWKAAEVGELVDKTSALDAARNGLSDTREGESIRKLHAAWNSAAGGHNVRFTTVVSIKKRPFDDYVPDVRNDTAHDLGDGLIGIMGQAVVPRDFSANPFGPESLFDIVGAFGSQDAFLNTTFLSRLDARFAGNMEQVFQNGREYYFALRAAHSCGQIRGGADCVNELDPANSIAYKIATYPADGRISVRATDNPRLSGMLQGDHPLKHFIESPIYLAESAVAYIPPSPPPAALAHGALVRNGVPASLAPVSFQLQRRNTGTAVGDVVTISANSLSGGFVFDAGATLGALFPGQTVNISDYDIVLRVARGWPSADLMAVKPLAADVDFGTKDITFIPVSAFVAAGGVVVNTFSPAQPLASAQIYLLQGENRPKSLLLEINSSTSTSRLVGTNAAGQFSMANVEPGIYTVLVTRPGYVDFMQGNVEISAPGNTALSFAMVSLNTSIDLPATAFVRGTNVALSANGYGTDTLMNAPPYGEVANAAEWDFNVPVAGAYELFAEYAAALSRPVNIAFNGTVKFTNALSGITGGWFPANRQTISQGIVTLSAGATTMRVSRSSVFPHIRGFKLVPITATSLFLDDFNGTLLDATKWNPLNWTGGPSLPYGLPTVGAGLVHLANCQGINTAGKVTLNGSKIVIESRFAGQKPTGRDTSIALVDPTTGLEFMFHDTNYQGWGQTISLAINGIGQFNRFFGGTMNTFKEYRVTLDGVNVTVERGNTLSTLNERFTLVLPRSVTDGNYYLRLGTGGCDGVYSPADFDWIWVTTY